MYQKGFLIPDTHIKEFVSRRGEQEEKKEEVLEDREEQMEKGGRGKGEREVVYKIENG